MKTKLTLLLLCFCSSVFSGDIILNTTTHNTDRSYEPKIWVLKKQSDGYLFNERGFDENLKIIDEDENMLILSSVRRDSKSPWRGLYFFVIHKIDKVFSYTFYSINNSHGLKKSPKDIYKQIESTILTGTVRFMNE
tara:strand:- start:452 stop:859 length:408 start_codon:yes stop_codon:yes gene_type:complete